MLQNDEVFMGRLTELQSLRSKLLEQKRFNSALEDQLNRATGVQMTIQLLLNNMEQQLQQQVSSDYDPP